MFNNSRAPRHRHFGLTRLLPEFAQWTAKLSPLVSTGLDDPTRYGSVAEGMDSLVKYFRKLVARDEAAPQDKLIAALIRARVQDDALSDAELIATCTLVLFGGHESTASFIANRVLALLRHPDPVGGQSRSRGL